ncbi:gamma-glutamyltransferase 7 [Plakobranchus ocellatus]|uniref:Gamma-glutamyltransferase 7 n=1 Tax=Plakobranchus ocellatus TaxID=259542 RepID=A0AAV3ZNR9_9GAST|nr:gamma-glutamyltransferase 7 [Plakobranchus ocellatus]
MSIERGIPQTVESQLRKLGHSVETISGHDRAHFGRGQIISQGSLWWQHKVACSGNETAVNTLHAGSHKECIYWAGTDPRADGVVAAY